MRKRERPGSARCARDGRLRRAARPIGSDRRTAPFQATWRPAAPAPLHLLRRTAFRARRLSHAIAQTVPGHPSRPGRRTPSTECPRRTRLARRRSRSRSRARARRCAGREDGRYGDRSRRESARNSPRWRRTRPRDAAARRSCRAPGGRRRRRTSPPRTPGPVRRDRRFPKTAPARRTASAALSSAQPLPHAPSSMPAARVHRVTRREDPSKVKRSGRLASRARASAIASGIRPPARSPQTLTRGPTAGLNAPPVAFSHSKTLFSKSKSCAGTSCGTPGAAAFSRARGVSSRHVERRASIRSISLTPASLARSAASRVGAETVRESAVPMAVRCRRIVSLLMRLSLNRNVANDERAVKACGWLRPAILQPDERGVPSRRTSAGAPRAARWPASRTSDLVGERGDLGRLVRDVEDRQGEGRLDLQEMLEDSLLERAVEAGKRLVEEQDLRCREQGPAEGDAAPLAAGKRRGASLEE